MVYSGLDDPPGGLEVGPPIRATGTARPPSRLDLGTDHGGRVLVRVLSTQADPEVVDHDRRALPGELAREIRPMPRPAPVTTATRPFNSISYSGFGSVPSSREAHARAAVAYDGTSGCSARRMARRVHYERYRSLRRERGPECAAHAGPGGRAGGLSRRSPVKPTPPACCRRTRSGAGRGRPVPCHHRRTVGRTRVWVMSRRPSCSRRSPGTTSRPPSAASSPTTVRPAGSSISGGMP